MDVETGEIISLEDLSREEWDERYGAQVPPPWEHFKEELEVRMGSDPKNDLDTHPDMYQLFRYPEDVYNNIRPIFVSRMPNHKVTRCSTCRYNTKSETLQRRWRDICGWWLCIITNQY